MQKLLSTSEFAEAVGISESTARRLADAGELRAQKTKGGHRKIPVSEAVRYVRAARIKVCKPELLGLEKISSNGDGNTYSKRLLHALREGHASAVTSLIRGMYMDGSTLAEICDGPIRSAILSIGSRWPQDKKSIFVEHRATLLCVRALCQIRLALPEAEEDAPTALGAAPQDDPYLLPSLMVSLVLHELGFNETNLGPNTPVDVLTDAVDEEQPDLVWLAITNPIRSRRHHLEIENLADAVQSYGGLFLTGGQNATTFTGPKTASCESMGELRMRASALRK